MSDARPLVLVDLSDPEDHLVLAAAAEPVRLGARRMRVTASLGISLYPQDEALDGDLLLRQADQAMYQAKQAGKNRYQVFAPSQA